MLCRIGYTPLTSLMPNRLYSSRFAHATLHDAKDAAHDFSSSQGASNQIIISIKALIIPLRRKDKIYQIQGYYILS